MNTFFFHAEHKTRKEEEKPVGKPQTKEKDEKKKRKQSQ